MNTHRLGGLGPASATAPSDTSFGKIYKRHRKPGMQTASTGRRPGGEVEDFGFVVCEPIGRNLDRLRGVLYHTVDTRGSQDWTDFLPGEKRLQIYSACTRTFSDNTSYQFCFVNKPRFLCASLERMRLVLNNAKLTEGSMISAPKEDYGLDDIKASILERGLLALMERLPIPLCSLADVLKHRLLVTALSMK